MASRVRTRLAGGTVVRPGRPAEDAALDIDAGGCVTLEADGLADADETIDVRGSVLLPGLVNAHTHAGMAVLRGLGDGLPLGEWLGVVQEVEGRLTHDELYWSLQASLCEMIRNGTTAFADMFFWDERLIDSVITSGMRVAPAPAVFRPDILAWEAAGGRRTRKQLARIEQLGILYREEPLVRVMYGPHTVYTCDEELLGDIAARAHVQDLGTHIHLSETAGEVKRCLGEHGVTPVGLADRAGLLTERTLVAHGTWVTADDCGILADRGCTVVHSPQSNLKLGSGIAPVVDLLEAGVHVALGTDGPASNDALDLFREMRLAASLQRGVNQWPDVLSADDVLTMATVRGSAGLGFGELRLDPGQPADVIVVDASGVRAMPMLSPRGYLCWSATGHDVTDVFVAGRQLLRGGVVQTIDEERVVFEVGRIRNRLGLRA